MKSLIQFIKESLVNESSSDFLLLKEYEDAEKYFNGEISFDEFMNSCIFEMEVGIRYMVENKIYK